jgi:hypothetical protein
MKLISVNVGLPREVQWKSKRVTTDIFKEPVHHRVLLRMLNLDGDRQADLKVHGGASKAVYAYPAEHYEFWRGEFSLRFATTCMQAGSPMESTDEREVVILNALSARNGVTGSPLPSEQSRPTLRGTPP